MSDDKESTDLTVVPPERGISASSSANPGQITETLKRALAKGRLLSPATTCGNLPPGCEVAFSAVSIDVERETYKIPGRDGVGLSKIALSRIAKAVGVDWDSRLSHRVDKGEDSNLAVYKAVGRYRDFDGSWRTIEGEKQMDLRDGSEAARSMKPGELAIQRKFIAEHAQTKAQLRAIRMGIGIETAYTPEFLRDGPFICARLIWTGQSDNPEIQKMFAVETARMMLGGVEALYGSQPQLQPSTAGSVDAPQNALPEASGESPAPTTESQPEVKSEPVWVVPFGKFKGTAIDQVPTEHVSGLIDYCEMAEQYEQDQKNSPEKLAEIEAWRKEILASAEKRGIQLGGS